MKVDRYIDLVSGLNGKIEEGDGEGDVKDPGTLDKVLCDICLQLLENSREIGRLSRMIERDPSSIRDEWKIEKMIADTRIVEGKALMTKREKGVMIQLLGGKTNREISVELGIDEKTVKNHLWKIYRKMGVNNRTQLLHKMFYQ